MDHGNVQSPKPVTLVGGGALLVNDIVEAMAVAPVLVAADGGANVCHDNGFSPTAVIGDLDSVTPGTRAALTNTNFIEITEQNSTDFEKCLQRIAAPFVLAVGFAGARLDHSLAVYSVLARRVGPPTVVLGETDIVFAAPDQLSIDLEPGTRVSLFPMARIEGRSTGLKWPIDGLILDPLGRVGTSNIAEGPITLDFDTPGCLVILPRAALLQVLAALTD